MSPLPPFHVMIKPAGARCNLACDYCFYLPKMQLYPQGTFYMSAEVLAEFTRQYLHAQPGGAVTFGWQGGEPTLMGLDFFEQALTLQRQFRQPGQVIHNTMQTNATLLDDDWCRFLSRHRFLVGVSLDGSPAIHDLHRVDRSGKPTFLRVMAGIELLKKYAVPFNILACVTRTSASQPVEVYRFLRDEVQAEFMQFIPVVEWLRTGDVSAQTVGSREWGYFLSAIFDEWVRRDVGTVFIQHFEAALAAFTGMPSPVCVHAETCGQALALEHTGDLYACDHFVTPEHRLGNILQTPLAELVASARQRAFGLAKRSLLPPACRRCSVRFACHGGCPKDRLPGGLNVLCAGYKAFFTHITPAMRRMAALLHAGQPPAGIMQGVSASNRQRHAHH